MKKDIFHKQPTLPEVLLGYQSSSTIPDQIGPYKIEALLSIGSMSILYIGIDSSTKEVRVIKVLPPPLLVNSKIVERFLKESKLVAMPNHPNVVTMYREGIWSGGFYIAMEFVRGVSLRQFIEQHSLSMRRALEIIIQVLYALHHLHSHGVFHGDIKPENILITEEGNVKVIDFGISQLCKDRKKEKRVGREILGTPSYMSPEQKERASNICPASDIYSLAIIAYELLVGELSFGIVHLSQLPKMIRKILEKALAVSLEQRYPDAMRMIADLSDYIKSGSLERDRPGSDQIKEFLEIIYRTGQGLISPTPTDWPYLQIGIARHDLIGHSRNYVDYFRLQDGSYLILLAEAESEGIEGVVVLSALRGIVRSLIAHSDKKIILNAFVSELNQRVYKDCFHRKTQVALLMLSFLREELSYFSTNCTTLFHLSSGTTVPHILLGQGICLGDGANNLFEIVMNRWHVDDTLVFHSFNSQVNPVIESFLKESGNLSHQSQADALMKKIIEISPEEKTSKMIAVLHRTN